jgi:hypothetical protein
MPDINGQHFSRDQYFSVKEYLDKFEKFLDTWEKSHGAVHEKENETRVRERELSDKHFVSINSLQDMMRAERKLFVTEDMHEVLENEVARICKEVSGLRGTYATCGQIIQLQKDIQALREEVSDFRGKWSILILGLAATISVITFIVEKIIAPLFGVK